MKYLIGAVLVALVAWGIVGQLRMSAAKARADDVREMLDSTRVEMERAQAQRHEAIAERMTADSARQEERGELLARLEVARMDMDRFSDTSDSLRQQLVTVLDSLPDSTRATVSNVVRVLTFEARACRTALGLADSLHILCGERLASRDSTIADLNLTVMEQDSLLHAEIALVETYRALASPNWLERIRQALPWVGVALAVGLGIGVGL